jgi:hypothetical protein
MAFQERKIVYECKNICIVYGEKQNEKIGIGTDVDLPAESTHELRIVVTSEKWYFPSPNKNERRKTDVSFQICNVMHGR